MVILSQALHVSIRRKYDEPSLPLPWRSQHQNRQEAVTESNISYNKTSQYLPGARSRRPHAENWVAFQYRPAVLKNDRAPLPRGVRACLCYDQAKREHNVKRLTSPTRRPSSFPPSIHLLLPCCSPFFLPPRSATLPPFAFILPLPSSFLSPVFSPFHHLPPFLLLPLLSLPIPPPSPLHPHLSVSCSFSPPRITCLIRALSFLSS